MSAPPHDGGDAAMSSPSHDGGDDDGDDGASASLLEPGSVIKLLISFLGAAGAGAAQDEARSNDEARSRAGEFLWDLSADVSHAETLFSNKALGVLASVVTEAPPDFAAQAPTADDGAFDAFDCGEDDDDGPLRWRSSLARRTELALGIAANLASHASLRRAVIADDGLLHMAQFCLICAEDSSILREACRLWAAAAAAGDGGAWADFIGTQVFSAKVGFIMHNALNIHLLASAFQLALAIAAWPSDGGPSAVSGGAFSALVRDQDLFGACITALSEAETLVQDGVSPDALPRLDVVLRVAALATDRHRPTRPVETALAKALLGTLASERSRSEHSCAVVALSKLNPSEFLSPAYFEDASRRTAVVAALAAVLDDALDDVLDDDDVLDPTDEFSAAAAAGHALRLAANVFSAAEAAARAAADGAPRVPSDPALHLATTRLLGIVLRLVENATEPAAAKMRLGHLRDRYADVVRYAEDATAPAPLAGSKRARDGG